MSSQPEMVAILRNGETYHVTMPVSGEAKLFRKNVPIEIDPRDVEFLREITTTKPPGITVRAFTVCQASQAGEVLARAKERKAKTVVEIYDADGNPEEDEHAVAPARRSRARR